MAVSTTFSQPVSSATRTKPLSSRRAGKESGRSWVRLIMAVLATIGLIDTGSITAKRWGWIGSLSCPGGSDGCDKVLGSAWGTLLGQPLSLFGFLAYATVLLLALMPLLRGGLRAPGSEGNRWALFFTSSGMAVFSMVLMGLLVSISNVGKDTFTVAEVLLRKLQGGLGVATVAVYSDADAQAAHVQACDQALHIGGAEAKDSYLQWQRIIDAARQTGAQAIHPGYGFLSENADFAQACADAGLVFIGPPPAAIRAMGLKAASKQLMGQAGVPLVPGYHGANQDPALLQAEADRIGYPALIKASAGGGGKGMRVVEKTEDFAAALASCQREAINSFGSDAVLIEKYVFVEK